MKSQDMMNYLGEEFLDPVSNSGHKPTPQAARQLSFPFLLVISDMTDFTKT